MKLSSDLEYQYVVIGAGLSALACVLALLERGIRPLVIDSGICETGNRRRKIHYSDKIFTQLKDYGTQGHIYASPFLDTELSLPDSPIAISSEMGGLSNVWGGGWQPINLEQYKWFSPIIAQQMKTSSQKLLHHFRFSGHEDDLNHRFPLPAKDKIQHFCKSEYDHFNARNSDNQSIDGVLFGFPRRLHCGSMCNRNHSLFDPLNAAHYFESLKQSDLIDFKQMRVVEIRKSSPLTIFGFSDMEAEQLIYSDKVLLAAGTFASSAIILRSLQEIDRVEIRDSQMFYMAFLSLKRSPFGHREKSEAFGNLVSSRPRTAQSPDFSCSIIGPSRDFRLRITNLLPLGIGRLLSMNSIVHRLYISIGFIDQDFSGKILLQKTKDEIKTRLINNSVTKTEVKKVRKLLSKWGRKRLLFMLPQFLTPQPKVGSGFHSGAISHIHNSIDSSTRRSELCELESLRGVYVIDTSSIPKIPAGAHSFIAMVNAFRVGSII